MAEYIINTMSEAPRTINSTATAIVKFMQARANFSATRGAHYYN